MRARIDGRVAELDDPPALDLRRKHTIEAVVDRFKVRADIGQRLAESFETALRLGNGIASIAFIDEAKRAELVFSDKFACNVCGWSLAELEPQAVLLQQPGRRLRQPATVSA